MKGTLQQNKKSEAANKFKRAKQWASQSGIQVGR